ncbi:zf-HC2 domain-containing protein [Lachnoclostridium phytofermentans]|uniref:Putative zinc-finger domain-containing protein n=1 Tax=Lachnoclostridium phytofermentans (strain ATCC 700394 / DSM 18823 / ISDg) TaxID=357809 RepID=A9KRU2_LACP7|nr:zf-HC2 domain-containing protein [Lachnoclostridium phytofermentans]ABX43586.1 hypothetical protein Cphy_3232 [Lachnoclostridium phytofermentans ISDg]
MELTCDVIKDLLPLYVENISSANTRIVVEEHIDSCDSCKKELDKFQAQEECSFGTNTLPLKKLQYTLCKRKYLTILFSVMFTLLVLIIVNEYLTAPEYIPYTENPVTITKTNNELFIVHFNIPGAMYQISQYRENDNSGYIYNISMWSSIWNRSIYKDAVDDFILNPRGEVISSVYYSSNDGTEDILIYGKDRSPNGGTITLPRLVLAYYATIAAVLAVILGIVLFLFRNNKKAKAIILKFFTLSISYLLGHICIKGFSTSSYNAIRDFYAILLAMIPIYCAMLIGEKLLVSRSR